MEEERTISTTQFNLCQLISMRVWDDGSTTLKVKCNKCGYLNEHVISHAAERGECYITIDYTVISELTCIEWGCNARYTI